MHICFLADANHVNFRNWAGHFAKEFGHDISAITLEKAPPLSGVNILEVKTPKSLNKAKYFWAIKEVRNKIQQLKPDLIVGYRVSSYGFLAACSGFHPVVLAAQGYNVDNPENSLLKDILIKFSVRKGDFFHAWGDHMARCFEKLGAPSDKIWTFPRGVKTELFELGQKREKDFSIIMTRGLKPGYDLDIPFRALEKFKKTNAKFKFFIAGDGPIKGSLKSLSKDLEIDDNVFFGGHIENIELPKVLSRAHVYISPVPTDGVSASMLEAMSCGLIPIVVNNEANRLWIKDGRNGLLFNAGDYRAINRALVKVVNHEIDIEKIRQYNRKLICYKADWQTNMKHMENNFIGLIQS